MKRVLIPILMLLVFTQTFHQLIIIAEYKINREFIANILCINKSKPQLNCKGKCQMKKTLQENDEQESPSRAPLKIKLEQQWFSGQLDTWSIGSLADKPGEFNVFSSEHTYPTPVLNRGTDEQMNR